MKHELEAEHDTHFVIHDGQSSFRVPKDGLSEGMVTKIRSLGRRMAEGGGVEYGTPSVPVGYGLDAGVAEAPQFTGPPVPLTAPMEVQTYAPPLPGGVVVPPAPVVPMPDPELATQKAVLDQQKKLSEESALPPGVRPKGHESKTEQPPETPAPPPVRPGGGGMRLPPDASVGEMDAATKAAMAAAEEQGRVGVAMKEAEAKGMVAQAKVLQDAALQEQDLRARAKASADAAMTRVKKAQDDIANMELKVDPGRFMATRSTAGKIGVAIGLALGALDPSGINRAAQLLQQQIDRDIDAQKSEHELKMKQKGANLEGARTIYDMQRAATGDELAALAASKSTAWGIAELKAKEIAATAAAPMAKANAMALIADIQARKAQFDADAHKRLSDEAFKRDASAQGWAALGMRGSGMSPEQSKVLTEQRQRATNMLVSLDKAAEIIKRSGTTELLGPDQKLLEKALTDYAIDSAKLKDPSSAAREGEVQTELSALGVKPGSWTLSGKTALQLIEKAKEDTRRRVGIAEGVR